MSFLNFPEILCNLVPNWRGGVILRVLCNLVPNWRDGVILRVLCNLVPNWWGGGHSTGFGFSEFKI